MRPCARAGAVSGGAGFRSIAGAHLQRSIGWTPCDAGTISKGRRSMSSQLRLAQKKLARKVIT